MRRVCFLKLFSFISQRFFLWHVASFIAQTERSYTRHTQETNRAQRALALYHQQARLLNDLRARQQQPQNALPPPPPIPPAWHEAFAESLTRHNPAPVVFDDGNPTAQPVAAPDNDGNSRMVVSVSSTGVSYRRAPAPVAGVPTPAAMTTQAMAAAIDQHWQASDTLDGAASKASATTESAPSHLPVSASILSSSTPEAPRPTQEERHLALLCAVTLAPFPAAAGIAPPEIAPPSRPCAFTSIRAGQVHYACVSNDGQVLTWGLNHKGQLGRGPTRVPAHAGREGDDAAATDWCACHPFPSTFFFVVVVEMPNSNLYYVDLIVVLSLKFDGYI